MTDHKRDDKIARIRQYMADNPTEALSVFEAVIRALDRDDEPAARYKIRLDSDKFSDRKKVLSFFESVQLWDRK